MNYLQNKCNFGDTFIHIICYKQLFSKPFPQNQPKPRQVGPNMAFYSKNVLNFKLWHHTRVHVCVLCVDGGHIQEVTCIRSQKLL